MTIRSLCVIALAGALAAIAAPASSQGTYEPSPIFCYGGNAQSSLCPVIPSGLDPASPIFFLPINGYNGLYNPQNGPKLDVQSGFDNMSWQTFIALNWTAGKENQPPQAGLQGDGLRVWETDKWPRISTIFHDSPVLAKCNPPPGMPVFQIGANTKGQPDGHNEEYIQAATDQPLIDIKGNWTIYERRMNGIEVAYLQAPGGPNQPTWNLTTLQGQAAFVGAKQTVSFPAFDTAAGTNGAMEIKAAWRIMDPADHAANAKRFYIVSGMLTVPSILVFRGTKAIVADVCAKVDFGLVGMHILQKNPKINVLPAGNWIWSTFEQVDNAPLSGTACDPATPWTCNTSTGANNPCPPMNAIGPYSFFDPASKAVTNQPPVNPNGPNKPFLWNGSMPYAYAAPSGAPGTQVSRCWQIYQYTNYLNGLWRAKLKALGSVFQNYMLVGTQWGAGADEPFIHGKPVPMNATPGYLSNSVIETFMQLQVSDSGFATGSCIACHGGATLKNQPPVVCNVLSDQSFVPGEATADLVREPLATMLKTPSCSN